MVLLIRKKQLSRSPLLPSMIFLQLKVKELVLDQDTTQEITFTAEDVDSETFTYSIVTAPTKGQLSGITDSKVTYTPNKDYHGDDSFTYKANDGEVDSEIATIILEITEVIKLEGDVNDDKTVNIFDLVMVASNFGKNQEVVASPAIVEEIKLTTYQKRQIELAMDQLESQLVLTSAEEIVLNLLKSIHPERLSTEPHRHRYWVGLVQKPNRLSLCTSPSLKGSGFLCS